MADPMTPTAVRRALDSDRPVAVIDVREPLDYSRGHIAESTPVPRRSLEFRLPEVVPGGDVTVVLCDQRGERAALDADWLDALVDREVAYLDGGVDGWEAAGLATVEAKRGVYRTAFNFPSKDFGERVQVEEGVERIEPDDLRELLDDEDEDVLVADVRTPEEHRDTTIPGALNLEGVDLGLYVDRLRDGDEPVVVHCTGRTRSIIGTASLEKLGFENVYELENGTMGWELAGYELERGASRHRREVTPGGESRDRLRARAESLLAESSVPMLSVAEFRDLLDDGDEVVYPVDVRTREEYEAGHVPHALSVPGGQAIQTADEHFAVRNGTLVFVSDDHVRSAITAYWFSEMGFPNVAVLEGGIERWQDAGRSLDTGRDRRPPLGGGVDEVVAHVSASDLADSIDAGDPVVVDVDTSERFERGHVPGARWVPRYRLEDWLDGSDVDDPLVLTCRHGRVSTYAAAAIRHGGGYGNVRVLDGGTEAWEASGRPLAEGTDGMAFEPRDEVPHPSEQGDWAKRAYLDWEEELGGKYA